MHQPSRTHEHGIGVLQPDQRGVVFLPDIIEVRLSVPAVWPQPRPESVGAETDPALMSGATSLREPVPLTELVDYESRVPLEDHPGRHPAVFYVSRPRDRAGG